MLIQEVSNYKSFDGRQLRYRHRSECLSCEMHFSLYLPPQAAGKPVPLLIFLSGLTCTDENFVQKAGAQAHAARHGIAILAPDTSPRGEGVPDDPEGAWDFGLGAGFYVNATEAPWNKHYKMYDYITLELASLIQEHFPVDMDRVSLMGHSMGGHGALSIGLRNSGRYRSLSAFAPICSPMNCPWGQKALSNYLGNDREKWKIYDSCELIRVSPERLPILIDQGLKDNFLQTELKTDLLQAASHESSYPINLRMQEGYDHSYFFIASFIDDHIKHHADALL